MEILFYDEVEDWQMSELNLACFDHPYSREQVEERIDKDDRVPDWGGELYAKEGEKLLGCVGVIYPKVRTKEGVRKAAGIRNVCTRPSESGKGVAKHLLERLHDIIEERGVRYSLLLTSAFLIAHNLYMRMGYRDIHKPTVGYKKVEDGSSRVRFEKEKNFDYVHSAYSESVDGLYGLVEREEDFGRAAEVRGVPDNDLLRIAYDENDERIGYIRFAEKRKHLVCDEIAVEKPADLSRIFEALEGETDGRDIVVKFVNPNYRDFLENYGFRLFDDLWEVIMFKDLENDMEESLDRLGVGDRFHVGIYEGY
ncbi:hypothetical protein AKJ61_00105 [candidate division MSBL1 archaeon SCGC-AAA259B11]|uniref:N-acetyltransferase domain-containing protein n=1 Tax=candidate division MSBL1 archaeon SCGC-AAA259B11 TaxID=1698260 RepID=A0A133U908_9EURY|nr:hypothetical protein AKJ61_00105 [candidate division MSBL1 archaeon SCGC-AAA259B11]